MLLVRLQMEPAPAAQQRLAPDVDRRRWFRL